MRVLPMVAVLVLFSAESAAACTCAPLPDPPQAFAKAAAVFTGVVRQIQPLVEQGRHAVTLQVVDSWQGPHEYYLTVYTAAQESMCGYPFAVDGYYVVYADRGLQGELTVSLCSRTRPFDPNSKAEDLEAIGFPPTLATLTPTHPIDEPALTSRAAQFPEPAWTVQHGGHGLYVTAEGLWHGAVRLALDPEPTELVGAALYEADGVLITVGADATVHRYARQSERWLATSTVQTGGNVTVHDLRWTRVPGVLYLLLLDVSDAARGVRPFAQRVTLTADAEAWHGLPVNDPDEWLLGGCYRVVDDGLQLSLEPGRWIHLPTPEPLAEPAQREPYDPVPQAVFVVPGVGIFCRTIGGWSWHEFDGTPKVFVPTAGIEADAWAAPEFTGAEVLLRARQGDRWQAFRLDADHKRLVPEALPDPRP